MAFGKKRRKEEPPFKDFAQIATIFDNMKKRWGAADVQLKFSAAPLMIAQPSLQAPEGQQAAAWYRADTKTIEVSVPSLQKVARQWDTVARGRQMKGGFNDAVLEYVLGVLTHELSHGLQGQEESAQWKRYQEHGVQPPNRPPDWPHDPRQQQRTHILNEAELDPFTRNRMRRQVQEDDPMFQGAPELMPSFFGNQPYRRGFNPFEEPMEPNLPFTIGGRGSS